MALRIVRVRQLIAAPAWAVFERVADHEGYARLPGVRRARLLRAGHPERNGSGAVRELTIGPGRLIEQVAEFQPPYRLATRLIAAPFPIEHRGAEVRLKAVAGGTEVVWTARFRARRRLGAATVERVTALSCSAAFGTALLVWKRSLEASHPRWKAALPQASPGHVLGTAPINANARPQPPRLSPRLLRRTHAELFRLLRGGLGLPARLLGRRHH